METICGYCKITLAEHENHKCLGMLAAKLEQSERGCHIYEKVVQSANKMRDAWKDGFFKAIDYNIKVVASLEESRKVVEALLAAVERADTILDQLDRDIDVAACLCQMNEAKRMAEDWENRE